MEKIIYYCWFGRNALSAEILGMLATWEKVLPDYKIIEINEDNFPIHLFPYAQEAYDAKRYAFVSDCARIYYLQKTGGIYFDTDVEVRRDFTHFITEETDTLFSMEYFFHEITGVSTAVIASKPNQPIWNDLLEKYKTEAFDNVVEPETINKKINNLLGIFTDFQYNDRSIQKINYKDKNIDILSSKTLMQDVEEAYAVHHLDGSWQTNLSASRKMRRIIGIYLKKIIGREKFERIWKNVKK